MPFRFFTIPVSHGEAAEKELNDFLAAHRTLRVDKEFVADGERSFWTVAVTYAAGKQAAAAPFSFARR